MFSFACSFTHYWKTLISMEMEAFKIAPRCIRNILNAPKPYYEYMTGMENAI